MTGGEREKGEQQEVRVGANQAPSYRVLSPKVKTVSSTQQRNAEEIPSGRAIMRLDDDRKKRNQSHSCHLILSTASLLARR